MRASVKTVAVAVAAAALAAGAGGARAEKTWPTPEIAEIVDFGVPGLVARGMRARLGDTDVVVGLGLLCATDGSGEASATAYFGGFPHDRRPVQLAVRAPDGVVHRFGPVARGGREHGFHSPRLVDRAEAERFARTVLRPGALVSNGYRSFWNRATSVANGEAREAFIACLRRR